MPRALMIQGTGSHVGKSVLTTAFACWLQTRGLRVAPFKAQNMSLNSFVTLGGAEIARSQAAQAEALGLEPTADMNPILLKPLDRGCQVIVQGHGVGVMSIQEYYAYKPDAWTAITTSYDRLAQEYDAVVLEGAGSPAEINLKANDLVNMRMAAHADAGVVLVGDIERGGVFAHLVGTWELLEADERRRVVGFLINKFRGDVSLLRSGLDYLERRTGVPVLGVLPYEPAVRLDEEDSLGLDENVDGSAEIEVAVLRLPGLSNFTDLAPLGRMPGVAVRFISEPGELHRPDLIVLPGTRTTVRALEWLRARGFELPLRRFVDDPEGPYVLGLCGGYQLLGNTIDDPSGVEWTGPAVAALGFLDVDTLFGPRKTLARVEAEVMHGNLGRGSTVIGYEIHQGETTRRTGAKAWLRLRRQPGGQVVDDGAVGHDGRVLGTYVHGLFDDARFCRAVVTALRRRRGLPPLGEHASISRSGQAGRLVGWLTEHCDLRPVLTAIE